MKQNMMKVLANSLSHSLTHSLTYSLTCIDGVSNEDEIAYTGSLFTIITVDITNPESANNAFNKYLPIRNKYM
jgi:hypothetical protein